MNQSKFHAENIVTTIITTTVTVIAIAITMSLVTLRLEKLTSEARHPLIRTYHILLAKPI
jgi:hypothetical protein